MKQIATKLGLAAITALLLASAGTVADAQTFNGTGTGGNFGKSASATFSVSGSTLTIDLFNTGQNAVSNTGAVDENSVLTALFFNVSGGTLNLASGTISMAGSTFTDNSLATPHPPDDTEVAQNWARKANVTIPVQSTPAPTPSPGNGPNPSGPADYGVSATAFRDPDPPNSSVFSNADLFDTSDPFSDLDGPNYGLVNGVAPAATQDPFINNHVRITFTGTNLGTATIDSVYFKYDSFKGSLILAGMNMNNSSVPEPIFVQMGSLLALGGAGSLLRLRRKNRA